MREVRRTRKERGEENRLVRLTPHSSKKAPLLAGRSFVVFPFQGKDEDGYVRSVLHSQFTKMGAHPVHASIAEWQAYLVANSQNAQSVEAMQGYARTGGHGVYQAGKIGQYLDERRFIAAYISSVCSRVRLQSRHKR